ncbi:hypothetical protein Acr_00g0003630 [Actinidia rufa]|uniref:Uncharacterized protein n=1 Tax=Actinidia rufa TaxID=165716 RepID=A0A7J0D903_9ERIC|nr:hypothetical protein Acr_00g0003630 [Actinidia rufa]
MFVHPARKLLKAGSHTGAVSLVTGEGASGRSVHPTVVSNREGQPSTAGEGFFPFSLLSGTIAFKLQGPRRLHCEEGRAFNWLDASTIACLEEIPYTSEPSVDDGLWVYELKEETDDAPPLNLESAQLGRKWHRYCVVITRRSAIPKATQLAFPTTNNVTEYEAFIAGQQAALQLDARHLKNEIKNSVHLTILLRLTVDKFSSPLFPYKVSLSSHSSRGSIFWTTLIASSKGLLFHFLSSSRLQTDPLFPLSPKRTELGA